MDAIALSTFAEPAAMPIPSSESPPTRGSVFGTLVAAVARGEEPEAESSSDTPVDAAALQLDSTADMPPPFIVRQWLAQTDSPALLPKGLISAPEKFQANEQDPVTLEGTVPRSSEPEEPAPDEHEDVPALQSARTALLEASEEAPASDGQPLRATAEANVSTRSPDPFEPHRAVLGESQRSVAPTVPFEELRRSVQYAAGIGWRAPDWKSDRASGEMTEYVTPRGLSGNAIPGRLAPEPPWQASMAAITRAAVEFRADDPSQRTAPPAGRMTDETTANAPDAPQTPEPPKVAQRLDAPPASQRPPELLPQFAANAQANTPAATPDGISAPPQVGNVSAAVEGTAEVPVKLTLATRDSQAAQMQTLALHIAARSARGDSRFTIRLDPPELGRIEVNLSVTSHGHAQAVLAVEKPQTLDLLLRDAPALERALKDAGLELGSSLSFSLKEEGRPHLARDERYPPAGRTLELVPAEAANALSALNTPLLDHLYGLRTARLDITV